MGKACVSGVVCTRCKKNIPMSMCHSFPYPIKARNWTCFPCKHEPQYIAALDHIAENKTSIAETAALFQVERDVLVQISRWNCLMEREVNGHIKATKSPLYNKTHLEYAVKYARENSCGCRHAARATEMHFQLPVNSIPHATVYKHIKHIQHPRRGKAGAKLKLLGFDEALVAQQWIQQQEVRGGPYLTKAQAATELISHLCRRNRPNPFANCVDALPSEGFWRGFLKRHPEVQFKRVLKDAT